MQEGKKILVILGPTSAGKTTLAVELLKNIPGEIVSADSRQVYLGLDYTTNKINPDQKINGNIIQKKDGYWVQDGIKINLYDLVHPGEDFSVSSYVDLAAKKIESVLSDNVLPVVVGGTGFYIDSLLGLSPFSNVSPDPELRRELQDVGTEELHRWLVDLDPTMKSLPRSEINNKTRLLRYIELARAAGSVKSAMVYFSLKSQIDDREISVMWIGLTSMRDHLYQRVDLWVDRLVESDYLISETEFLRSGLPQTIRLLRGLIYNPTIRYLDQEITKEQLRVKIKGQLHKYIRRQLIWFKRNPRIEWVDISESAWRKSVLNKIKEWYYGRDS